jgi:hypothetical protein
MAIVGCTFLAAQLVLARQDVDDAARTALQAAVSAADAQGARLLAKSTSRVDLETTGDPCLRVSTATDTAGFEAGGSVTVRVTCVVSLWSLPFAGIPGETTLSASLSGAIAPYREVGP